MLPLAGDADARKLGVATGRRAHALLRRVVPGGVSGMLLSALFAGNMLACWLSDCPGRACGVPFPSAPAGVGSDRQVAQQEAAALLALSNGHAWVCLYVDAAEVSGLQAACKLPCVSVRDPHEND